MIEIELKYKIDDLEKLRSRLEALGLSIISERSYEMSVMYDNPQGLMQKKDGRIRVRESNSGIEFCYKQPLTREGIKQEVEYEVSVSNLDNLVAILKEMNYMPTTSYERYRTVLQRDGIKVALDEYPFASFIEIEGNKTDIVKLATELGLARKDNLTDSCDTLFTKWRLEGGLKPTPHMRFNTYDK